MFDSVKKCQNLRFTVKLWDWSREMTNTKKFFRVPWVSLRISDKRPALHVPPAFMVVLSGRMMSTRRFLATKAVLSMREFVSVTSSLL